MSKQKAAENKLSFNVQALRKSKSLYAGLFSNIHTIMLIIDPKNGTIIDANLAACTYYGYTCDEMQTMNISDINILTQQEIQSEIKRAKQKQKKGFIRLKRTLFHEEPLFSA